MRFGLALDLASLALEFDLHEAELLGLKRDLRNLGLEFVILRRGLALDFASLALALALDFPAFDLNFGIPSVPSGYGSGFE